ncbi:hypothetical protein Ga0080574_TMP3308 [Salipiger abyssi]|uniref:Uncharacterized protein n=1 Tax=Salipiger abyssi TaxID=1250539 RepID=A0A1P8UW76_9RHOB|nr:hypothetical protein Ga0080574_TMP3308 [Salipiger abyssi]
MLEGERGRVVGRLPTLHVTMARLLASACKRLPATHRFAICERQPPALSRAGTSFACRVGNLPTAAQGTGAAQSAAQASGCP